MRVSAHQFWIGTRGHIFAVQVEDEDIKFLGDKTAAVVIERGKGLIGTVPGQFVHRFGQ